MTVSGRNPKQRGWINSSNLDREGMYVNIKKILQIPEYYLRNMI
jgi:hypothetical protein